MKFNLLILILLLNGFLFAQKKSYNSVRWNGIPMVLDGYFDDDIWLKGEWSGNFTQNSPHNGEAPSQKTEFKILYDDNFMYVAIRAYDNEPDKVDARMSRRDGWTGDRVALEIDSYNDNRTGFIFCVSASGVKNDGIIIREDGLPDGTLDPIWFVKTKIVSDGWNAEIKIPLTQLKYSSEELQNWGVQVVRFLNRNQEFSTWAHVPDNSSGWVNHYGSLVGLKDIKRKKQIEIEPFALTGGDFDRNRTNNPLTNTNQFKYDMGVNGKIGLNNYLTLDFSINPDFGQVEADPSNLNLTEFEAYFQEKRPFFLEGQNILSFRLANRGSGNLYYSRRIGGAVQGIVSLNSNEYIDIPERTRILGALKLTGKTKSGWSIGIMESFTNKENARVGTKSTSRKEPIEPFTNYFAVRVEKDLNKGNTVIGGLMTSTYRFLDHSNFDNRIKSAFTGGINFKHFFNNRKHYLGINLSGSRVSGSETAILRQQFASSRYFQRPDTDYMELDPSRKSLSGTSGMFAIGKNVNGGFNYSFMTTWRSPEFEINDIGFSTRSNLILQELRTSYTINKPHLVFKRSKFEIKERADWDFGGNRNKLDFNHTGYFLFKNLWEFNYSFGVTPVNIRPTALRGGAALRDVPYHQYDLAISTNRAKKMRFRLAGWKAINGEDTGESWDLTSSIHYRPIDALDIGIAANYGKYQTALQYVRTINSNSELKYIFGSIEQKLINFITKIEYNITPDFTIQYYGSPYITSGNYNDFKNVNNPSAKEFIDRFHTYGSNEISYDAQNNIYNVVEDNSSHNYSFRNPNFNYRDFRSNLVLRWEYKPGSSIYLVWSQSKNNIDSIGEINFKKSFKDLFASYGRNIIMLKYSYRIY